MFRENEKSFEENGTAFAFAILLLNVSILAATFSIGWLAYWFIIQLNQLESFLRLIQPN